MMAPDSTRHHTRDDPTTHRANGVGGTVSGMGRRARGRSVAAAVLMAVLLTASSRATAADQGLPAERIDTGFAGAVQISDLTVPTAQRPTDDPTVAAVLTDLTTYWKRAVPATFHVQMTALRGGFQSIDPAATGFKPGAKPLCITAPSQIAGNAYYCPGVDGLMFDSGALVPVLLGQYGDAGLIGAFGHEYGHAIQVRVGPAKTTEPADPQRFPSIVVEEAADCYSGAFLAWVTGGHAQHLHVPHSALVRAVAPLLDFRDPVNMEVDDPTAHGLAIDRLIAVVAGLRAGPAPCQAMTAATVRQTLGRAGVSTTNTVPRFGSETALLTAARTSLSSFVAATLPQVATAQPSTPSSAELLHARPFGQFAVAAAQAFAQGETLTGDPTTAACFTGAWTSSIFGTAPAGDLGSWAGDPDEALDYLRARPDATIDQLAGYADGFRLGWAGCRQ